MIIQAPKASSLVDNDCACVTNDPGIIKEFSFENNQGILTGETLSDWKPAPSILFFPLPSGQTMLINPNGNRGPVLLGQQELQFLEAFNQPLLPNLVEDFLTTFSTEQIRGLLKQFVHMDLLTPVENDCACASISSSCGQEEPVPATLTAWLHMTDRCNLRCSYCFLPHVLEDMSIETGRASVDATFQSARAHGFKQVKLKYAGGEPLLRFPLIAELHRYAQSVAGQSGIELQGVILSNGTLLTPGMISTMRSLDLRLMISLDGLGKYHDSQRPYAGGRGSSRDVLEAVEMARANGLTPNISITVSGRNVVGLPEVLGWVLENELPFSVNFYRENDLSASHAGLALEEQKIIDGMRAAFRVVEANLPRQSLLASLTDRANLSAPHLRTCGVGQNYLVFNAQGSVSKCHMQMRKPVEIPAGTDTLTALRTDASGIQNISVEEKEGCRDCPWRYWCAGGCPLATHRATGRYDVKSPNCNIYQAIFPEILRLEGLRLLKYQDQPEIAQKIVV